MSVSRVRLADEGPEVSRLVYGLWRLADWEYTTAELADHLTACLEMGVTTFDHADIYGDYQCEELFGRVLEQRPDLRDDMELISKCGIKLVSENRPDHRLKHYDTSTDHILESVDRSLENLRTEYLDLLLIHRPDPLMDPHAVAEAFYRLREDGRVRHFGVSNFTPSQYRLLDQVLDVPLVTNQVELSVLAREGFVDGTVDQLLQRGRSPMAWSPMGGGDLFTKETKREARVRDALRKVGEELGGYQMDQVALAFLLRHPADVVPIIGTGKRRRIERAVEAMDLELGREQWYVIWEASRGEPVP